MSLAPEVSSSTDPATLEDGGTHVDAPELRLFVMALFFIFGGITSLNDVLIPKLKELFTLSYMQAMLVQSAFFGAYFIVSGFGAMLVKRVGYMRSATIGLLTMMAGCLLFIPASASATSSTPPMPPRAGGRWTRRRCAGGRCSASCAGRCSTSCRSMAT